jgi:hypothetical protein
MKSWEFSAQINPDHTFTVPPEVAQQLEGQPSVQVVLLVGEPRDEQDWARLTAQQFLAGYAEGDNVYDQLSAG